MMVIEEKVGVDGKTYRVAEGTWYHKDTLDDVILNLSLCRDNHTRIVVDYGDVKTGRSWNEVYDTQGHVGRSTGPIKIPLLIFNSRSLGGPGMLEHCILSIKTTKGKKTLWEMPDLYKKQVLTVFPGAQAYLESAGNDTYWYIWDDTVESGLNLPLSRGDTPQEAWINASKNRRVTEHGKATQV